MRHWIPFVVLVIGFNEVLRLTVHIVTVKFTTEVCLVVKVEIKNYSIYTHNHLVDAHTNHSIMHLILLQRFIKHNGWMVFNERYL